MGTGWVVGWADFPHLGGFHQIYLGDMAAPWFMGSRVGRLYFLRGIAPLKFENRSCAKLLLHPWIRQFKLSHYHANLFLNLSILQRCFHQSMQCCYWVPQYCYWVRNM